MPDSIYAGAPYLKRLKTGECILSFQSTLNRNNKWNLSCMYVAIGDKDGRHFGQITRPFNIPDDKFGLWNSLTVLADNTVIAVTSTNAFSERGEVWMIKGQVVY